jgi:transposase-like protein
MWHQSLQGADQRHSRISCMSSPYSVIDQPVSTKRFFRQLLKKNRGEPRKILTDKLRSFGIAHQELIPDAIHDTSEYANNSPELSHQPMRARERGKQVV